MATAKQLAWRKKFAAMARAGTLRKVNPARKTVRTAATKTARKPVAKKSITRASQVTRKPPTKRLKTRRTIQARSPKRGYFPNPRASTLARVKVQEKSGVSWKTIAMFPKAPAALEYARACGRAHPSKTYQVIDD